VRDSEYAAAFGLQWQKYRRTQLDSHTGLPISEARLKRCLGKAAWDRVTGASVLEAGCGAGRFTEVLLARGAHVVSIDLSEAVLANAANFPPSSSHHIAQADILELPFSPRQFDIVLCLGVLQHTPDPEAAIERLYEQVKPGGYLVVDHYAHGLGRMTRLAPLFRQVLKRLSPVAGLRCTEALVRVFFPLHRATRSSYLMHLLITRVSPLIVFFHSIPQLSDQLHREWSLLDTHDSLTDWYKHLRTKRQLARFLQSSLDAQELYCEYGGNGVEVRVKRPPESPRARAIEVP
jgi:SAM-dependent methyltransferase